MGCYWLNHWKKLRVGGQKSRRKEHFDWGAFFQVFHSSAHRPSHPRLLAPRVLFSCRQLGVLVVGVSLAARGWTNAKPAWTGGQLTPAALHCTEAQTDRAFMQPSLRRVLLGCLGTYALRHDVGNLRQWTPRRDFIRFWRYVDCPIQWLYGATLCCQ